MIARESADANTTNEMNAIIKSCMETLKKVEEQLPIALKRNKMLLGHLQKFEDGLQQYQQWFQEAKQLMSRYSIQVPVKRIEEFLDQHRVSFVFIHHSLEYLKSMSSGFLLILVRIERCWILKKN
jgi:hypothetical protein